MTAQKTLLSLELLEDLAYQRSKWWGDFLKEVEMRDSGEPIQVCNIEQVYGNDDDEGEWTDFEEAEEVSEDAAEPGVLDVTTAEEKRSFIESPEVQDMLNATLPILKEHKRKWEAAGLERVLNTFDSVRIDEEVGAWMRRKHTENSFNKYASGSVSDSDSDSLLSSETADYIRSTQRSSNQRRQNCMTSIRKFKRIHKMRHKEVTVIEATTYRAYNCHCNKYSLDGTNEDCKSSPINKKLALLTTNKPKKKRFYSKSYSSSDSDDIPHKPPTAAIGNELLSSITSKLETPPKSPKSKLHIPKTAPSRITKKRKACLEALKKIQKKSGRSSHSTDEKANTYSSSENDSLFKIDSNEVTTPSVLMKQVNQSKYRLSNCDNSEPITSDSITRNERNRLPNTLKRLNRANGKQTSTLKKIDSNDEHTKENTFLSNQENICNSTEINNFIQTGQQLPTIHEDPSIISSTLYGEKTRKDSSLSNPLARYGPDPPSANNGTSLHNLQSSGVLALSTPTQIIDKDLGSKRTSLGKGRKSITHALPDACNAQEKEETEVNNKPKRFLIYKPQQKEQTSNDSFQVTKEILSSVIGEKYARRFMKYNLGRLTFPKTSAVYFYPPETELSSSDSDDDPLERAGLCGELNESK